MVNIIGVMSIKYIRMGIIHFILMMVLLFSIILPFTRGIICLFSGQPLIHASRHLLPLTARRPFQYDRHFSLLDCTLVDLEELLY